MTGLAPQTAKIYPDVATLQCIKKYHLVGGTSLSLQINHRLSEDLDFCKWVPKTGAQHAVDYKEIEEELKLKFSGVSSNPMSFDQCDFRVKFREALLL